MIEHGHNPTDTRGHIRLDLMFPQSQDGVAEMSHKRILPSVADSILGQRMPVVSVAFDRNRRASNDEITDKETAGRRIKSHLWIKGKSGGRQRLRHGTLDGCDGPLDGGIAFSVRPREAAHHASHAALASLPAHGSLVPTSTLDTHEYSTQLHTLRCIHAWSRTVLAYARAWDKVLPTLWAGNQRTKSAPTDPAAAFRAIAAWLSVPDLREKRATTDDTWLCYDRHISLLYRLIVPRQLTLRVAF